MSELVDDETGEVLQVQDVVDPTLDNTIKTFIALRDKKAAVKKAQAAVLKQYDDAMDEIGVFLKGWLAKQKVNAIGCDAGVAFIRRKRSATIADTHAFREFVIANNNFQLAEFRASVEAVEDYDQRTRRSVATGDQLQGLRGCMRQPQIRTRAMTNELTIFKNGAAPSTAFKGVTLPKARLGDGIEGGMPWCRIGYRGKDWMVKDGSKEMTIKRIVDGQSENSPNLDVVILKAANHPTRRWYKNGYEPGSVTPPDCYSTGGFKPDAAATDKQEGKDVGCLNCQWNRFGSKEGSKGKACHEYKTLAVVPVGDIENKIYAARCSCRSRPIP